MKDIGFLAPAGSLGGLIFKHSVVSVKVAYVLVVAALMVTSKLTTSVK